MIELERFSCFYGSKQIVKDCSLTIRDGELTGLLGANGCGKSTLIRGICRSISTGGICRIDGCAAANDPRTLARHLAYISQRCGVNVTLPILDVVLMGASHRTPLFSGYSRQQVAEARAVLRRFISIAPETDFQTLSEGQKQLVILARAFFQGAGNLLLDEPESALDFDNRHSIMGRIADLSKSGKCILITLHDPALALRYCDRLLWMKDGRIIADARPADTAYDALEAMFRLLYTDVRLLNSSGRLILDRM